MLPLVPQKHSGIHPDPAPFVRQLGRRKRMLGQASPKRKRGVQAC